MPTLKHITAAVFTVADFLTREECRRFIAQAEAAGFGDAPINSALGVQVVKEVRNNERVILDDAELATQLWERVREYVPQNLSGFEAIGVNERFRFYRYDPGQMFRWHRDGAYIRTNGERSRLTFMIYLNDDFKGGATRFQGFDVQPSTGTALFFVHQLLHEGGEVTRGRKYVLRTDVMYSRQPITPAATEELGRQIKIGDAH